MLIYSLDKVMIWHGNSETLEAGMGCTERCVVFSIR